MVRLDRTNLRLLELLQKNARMSVSDLARAVNRGESTVRERVAALERDGILTGYQAAVDPAALGYPIRAIVRASIDARALATLAGKLQAIPNVVSAHVTTGIRPVRIEIVAEDLQSLERILAERIAPLNVGDLETGVVLETLVVRRPPPIPGPVSVGASDMEPGGAPGNGGPRLASLPAAQRGPYRNPEGPSAAMVPP